MHECNSRLTAALLQDATRILREIKLLRQLKHPDIVEIKHILLPPHPQEFKDIFVVFELMETDLHQVRTVQSTVLPGVAALTGLLRSSKRTTT
jgi:serine/threonine protein kinase